LALVEWLGSQALSPTRLLGRIREERTISESVRQHALALAEPYLRGLVRRNADELIRSLSDRGLLQPNMLAAIRAAPGLSSALRQEALAQAEHYVENPEVEHTRSRSVVRSPGKDLAAYRKALRRAETACRLCRDNRDYLLTLGMARYRVGEDTEALHVLLQARRLHGDAPPPALLAFLAMTHHRLGNRPEAQAALGHLRETMRQGGGASQEEAKALLVEATAVVTGQPAAR
jgi:hypothetical protein